MSESPTAPSRQAGALAAHFLLLGAGWLYLHWNVQTAISQDHGRDLLCYARVAAGETPYVDFQWIYGPLAPYVYGALFRLVGPSVAAARDAYLVLVLLGAAATAWAARRALPPAAAHVAGVLALFWGGAPHSYNQVLLLPVGAAGTGALLGALASAQPTAAALAAVYGCGLLAGLIKLNVGLAWLAAASLALLARAQAEPAGPGLPVARRILAAAAAALLGLALAYLPFYAAMPEAHRRLCFGAGARYGFQGVVLEVLLAWPTALGAACGGSSAPLDLLDRALTLPFLGLCGFAGGAAALLLHARRGLPWNGPAAARLGLWLAAVLLAHELPILGTPYALSDASLPPLLLLLLGLARPSPRPALRRALLAAWLVAAPAWLFAAHARGPEPGAVPLGLARAGGLRVFSHAQREELEATVRAVQRLTRPGEPVAVLPYDPLYAFLADRPSPLWAMPVEAFEFAPADEDAMIAALERAPVRCVVVTNFALSLHPADGIFGVTHLPRLAGHVGERFAILFSSGFAPWQGFPFHPEGAQSLVLWRRGSDLPPEFPR